MKKFDFDTATRTNINRQVFQLLENFIGATEQLPVATDLNVSEIKLYAQQFNFMEKKDPIEVINAVADGLKKYAVHTPHPSYFGLFNPRASFLSSIADYITAVFNPQIAAWSHAPYAAEIERCLITEFGKKFAYQTATIDGTFCTGGAESNLTAILCALNQYFPNFPTSGIRGISKSPIIYCSSESHHSLVKATRVTGLGSESVVIIPAQSNLKMDTALLKSQIAKDIQAGHQPFMIVGTGGTTGAGAIDDLKVIAAISRANNLWFHVDAAYGGAAAFSTLGKDWLKGIEQSDSITLDIHKWFSVPMGTSLFLTSKNHILHQTFGVSTKYMPQDGDQNTVIDPYIHSIQWSRRFNGLKLYLPLATFGWEGYAQVLDHQIEMGDLLKKLLSDSGWIIKNDTPLPIVCFSHPKLDSQKVMNITDQIIQSGKAWLSVYPIHGENTFRACITNFATQEKEVLNLVSWLNGAIN